MMMFNTEWIIYEDADIIVIYKPAGLATQTAKLGQKDLVSELKNYLAHNETLKKGASTQAAVRNEPYVGVVHRLDQPVEGILVFAKNREAASFLSAQGSKSVLKKIYRARVYGHLEGEGRLTDYLIKDGRSNLSEICSEKQPGAQKAELKYRVVKQDKDTTLIEVELITGRHHQIRVQLAHKGFPLIGDFKYGTEQSMAYSTEKGIKNAALCAVKLTLTHPGNKKKTEYKIISKNPLLQ